MCKLPVIPAVRRCSGRLSSAVPPRYTISWCDIDSIPSFSDAVRYDGACVPLSQRTISFHVWRVMDSNHRYAVEQYRSYACICCLALLLLRHSANPPTAIIVRADVCADVLRSCAGFCEADNPIVSSGAHRRHLSPPCVRVAMSRRTSSASPW